jgi:hypothetical protein
MHDSKPNQVGWACCDAMLCPPSFLPFLPPSLCQQTHEAVLAGRRLISAAGTKVCWLGEKSPERLELHGRLRPVVGWLGLEICSCLLLFRKFWALEGW